MAIRNFPKIFEYYSSHPNLKNTFAEVFYKNYQLYDDKEGFYTLKSSHVLLKLTVPATICNFNRNVHGGAFATILDTSTTVAIMKYDKNLRKNVTI